MSRGRQPASVFDALSVMVPTDYTGVVRPWAPKWHFEIKTNSWEKRWKLGQLTLTHHYLVLQFPSTYTSQTLPSPLLLNSQHGRFRVLGQAGWLLPHDYRFVASLVPHSLTPLHWHVVYVCAAAWAVAWSSGIWL